MDRAHRRHVCLDCRYFQEKIWKTCPECGGKSRQYFMSKAEHQRGMLLLTMQAAGTIERLRFQPRFDLMVNGLKVAVYTADCDYYQGGEYIVEDTKPEDFMDDFAKLKMRLFQAVYGITVKIPQRKSGNISKTPKEKDLLS